MKYLFFLIFALILIWIGGLVYFIYDLSQMTLPREEKTNGVVVLTGGKNRLKVAVNLLENGLAGRLFISGVNKAVTDKELFALLGSSKELSQCCIESGIVAQNTAGNAREIAQWVAENDMTSIRVVTSLEHMPRTLVEMRHVMPHIRMIAHPVGQWRPGNIHFLSLVREYSKYLASLLLTSLSRAKTLEKPRE